MSDTNDMVKFLMPDGTEVSNDPRFGLQDALQKQLDAAEYRGDAGIPANEQEAQTQVTHLASIQSGQPGVGENATVDDPVKDAHGPLGSPAQQRQVEDMKKAEELGGTPQSTAVEDPDPVDSNEAVQEVRESEKKAREAYRKAQEKLAAADEEEGDPDTPLSEWSAKQLQAEIAKRNADGRSEDDQLKIKKGMKKPDVVAMLEEDNARNQGGTPDSNDEN